MTDHVRLEISFADLQPQHCRYPEGDGLAATYCGQPTVPGQSYCEHCYQICYTRPKAAEEKRKAA